MLKPNIPPEKICTLILLYIQLQMTTITLAKFTTNNNGDNNGNSNQRYAMEPQDQTSIVGSRVTLPCRVIGKQGQLQWTKDDFGLGTHRNLSGFERYSMVGSDEEGDFSLDIYPVMLDDDAKYQCQVGPGPHGEPGIRSRFATITVLVPPEPPKIMQGEFLITTEDREIELECVSLGGKPAAEITWIDGFGNVLTNGIEYMIEPLSDSRRFTAKSILKLTPKKEHHNTTFTCQAQNTADRTYRSAKLKLEVKYAPKVSVKITNAVLTSDRIPEFSDVHLSCQSDANPPDVTYRWYIQNELVIGDYTTELVIHNVTRNYHDASVKCEVYNSVGKSEESESLDISYGPVFKLFPKSMEADIGTTAVLACQVDGNPAPDIFWVHDPSEKIVGTQPNLTFTVTQETAGKYLCKANVIGFPEIYAEATIYLKGPPTITSTRRQYGIIGDNTRLECIAFSVPKARHVSWTFNGHEINTNNDPDYSVLEDPLSDGIKSTLIIRESQSKHFGRYNCTVVNDHGNDVLEIDLIAQKNVPSLMVIVGAVTAIGILVLVVLIFILYFKKGKKKLPPADVIPEHHHINEKQCKESDRSSNISDLKVDIRAGSCEPDYTETCSARDSITTRIAANKLGSSPVGGGGGGGGGVGGGIGCGLGDVTGDIISGVPLAGPVKIPNDYRYSGEYIHDTLTGYNLQSIKSGQNNNGYVTYADYSLGYSPPLPSSPQTLPTNRNNTINNSHININNNNNNNNNSNNNSNSQSNINNNNKTNNSNSNSHLNSSVHMNGQISSGNFTLTRNRNNDLRQDNGLPNIHHHQHQLHHLHHPQQQGSLSSLQGSLLGQPLLQNGLNIDPRYSAAYCNPFLKSSNSSLPPLPPPSTANPAATPAPPPYNAATRNSSGITSNSNNIALLLGNTSHKTTITPTSTIPSIVLLGTPTITIASTTLAPTITTSPPTTTPQITSPSGQFILPANGNLKKGALATHV